MTTAESIAAGAGGAEGEPWFRAPRQERSQETLDRLLDALAELLDERDFDDISVADIAARADRTVGSFYGRFDDKDAALYALHARHLREDRLHATQIFAGEALADLDLATAVRRLVEVLVASYVHPRSSFREVVLRSAQTPPFLAQCADMARFVGDLWTAALVPKVTGLDPACASDAAARSFRTVLAVLNQLLLFGPLVLPEPQTETELVDDLTETVLCLLCTPESASD